ncbi:helix-turn-helix domain-containing protein [Luteimonas terrae]|uniref:Transcriptional regulator with XRE-family HTH domain n=1 Tax=Luteimonas terrae TaxID=1530191 RepID=A0ABU1XX74_9GAMM|nr:helix-turn-helix transcriptional regulator [Luteimonas terrae]MDR7193369.1 transcriptional regulator with XRE-family HTH domain [Luteimonas terrae]
MDTVQPSLICVARLKKGLTQRQLGERLGVTVASVSGWERGESLPDSRKLAGLNAALRPHFKLNAYLQQIATESGQAA